MTSPELPLNDHLHPGQMRLTRIQVHNWGTFDGSHSIDVPRAGLLITGESGSGKSSLLDALSAVLMRPGETRFNAAAQDGPSGDKDRTPLSYVRGAYRRQSDDETGEVRPGFLRSSATVSGIALTYTDGRDRVVSAVRVFHIAGRSTSTSDLRTAYLLLPRASELVEVLRLCAHGIDLRRLRRALSPTAASTTYPDFGAHLRRQTGIGTAEAQRLLHRTQSAKSLTSLDDLLRSFMLTTPRTFVQAEAAVDQFRALQDAHAAVVDARDQITVLHPQREAWQAHRSATAAYDQLVRLEEGRDAYRYRTLLDLAEQDRRRLITERQAATARLEAAQQRRNDARHTESRAREALLRVGGSHLESLDREIQRANDDLDRIGRALDRLQQSLEVISSPLPTTPAELAAAQDLARRERDRLTREAQEQIDQSGPVHVAREQSRNRIAELTTEIRSLATRRSNLPTDLVTIRDQIAQKVGATPFALPFAGELMDVRDASWQGAVERLLRGFATTILVPDDLYPHVAQTVEATFWGRRIAYERMREPRPGADERRTNGRVLSVLTLADTPARAWLRQRISSGFPHVLVDTIEELGRHERALTRGGQIKNRDHHVKDDSSAITDRSRWLIGTTNDALIELRRDELAAARADLQRADQQLGDLGRQGEVLRRQITAMEQLTQVAWEEIDRVGVATRLEALTAEQARLRDTTSVRDAENQLREASAALHTAEEEQNEAHGIVRDLDREITAAEEDLDTARATLDGIVIDDAVLAELNCRALRHVRRTITRANLLDVLTTVSNELRSEMDTHRGVIQRTEGELARARVRYMQRWPERSVNLVDALEGTPDFLRLLEQLERDRLPEFEDRFRQLLRTQSQNNIGQLRAELSTAIRDVHQRLEPVNVSLAMTDFDTNRGTRLRLVARAKHSDEVKEFLSDLLRITEGAFHSETELSEEADERFARMDRLMRRLGSVETTDIQWRKRVLDSRRHVEFEAQEMDRDGTVVDIYEGAGGRSGGQRQRLVTFCLAAALRYQLPLLDGQIPQYGLVALDEAFDKTDMNFTRAGLDVFRSFGFQMLLATPLKMLQTIDEYVGGAVVVSNLDGRASRLAAVTVADLTGGEGRTR